MKTKHAKEDQLIFSIAKGFKTPSLIDRIRLLFSKRLIWCDYSSGKDVTTETTIKITNGKLFILNVKVK